MESPTADLFSDPSCLIPLLRKALRDPLPGPEAQYLMAPPLRQNHPRDSDHPRESAVLALLHCAQHEVSLSFTLRPASLKHHGGQICFPGGGIEPQDETCMQAALRETGEELGIPTIDVQVLGEMTPLFIAPSQNLVHPFVGWLGRLPPTNPDPVEVSAVLTVSLRHLLDPHTRDVHYWQRNGQRLAAPCYRIPGGCIWGATAMMLSELLTIIRGLSPLPQPHTAEMGYP